jgi:hypothetical protein
VEEVVMPVRYSLLTFVLLSSVSRAADVHTLTGKEIKGKLTAIDAKEIVITTESGEEEKVPVEQVLDVQFDKPNPPPLKDKFTLVELVDGTQFICAKAALKGKQVKASLMNGKELNFEQVLLKFILNDAQEAALAKQWREAVLSQKHATDVVAGLKNGQLNPVDGTFGDADEVGEKIKFTLVDGKTSVDLKLANIKGMLFVHGPAPNALPLAFKAYDASGNVLMIGTVAMKNDTLTLTTTAGVQIDATTASLARFDYSKGKLNFLSDLTPVKVVHTTTEGFPQNYRRDVNLDGGPLKMATKVYRKGLAIHSRTELEYDLNGEYREFKADIGFDSQVGGTEGPVVVVIEGDGKELRSLTLDRTAMQQAYVDVTVNIKDVNRLKIIVKSGSLLDLGKHVDLGNAKVSK